MPRLIYLRQRSVAETVENLVAVRGSGWAERAIQKAVESPYGRAHGLQSIEGFVRFWSDYQGVEDQLYEAVCLPKLTIDVRVGDWAAVDGAMSAWLELPPAETVDPGELSRFAGDFRAPDGSVVHIEHTAGALRVRGLQQVWPGQRLVPVSPNTFEVLSLPFTIRFADGGLTVEGPALLGGRPLASLERLA